jgi:lysophospholipase L1-like esterase
LIAFLACAGTLAAHERDEALALGDSVVFGYITGAGYEYRKPANFLAYPDYLGSLLDVDVVNAACPGEATGGFLSLSSPDDNGCRSYRAAYPLHITYTGAQIDFAIEFLHNHPRTRFVSIGLGANDASLVKKKCASAPDPTACFTAAEPGLVALLESNMAKILADLRGTGFAGAIVIVNYYSIDYADATQTNFSMLLNRAISAPAQAYGATIADVFTAFQRRTADADVGANTCRTGLLNVDPQDTSLCDKHPTLSGHQLIASTVAHALVAAQR